jgi:RNAse (barnase) inhibitor barstar
MSANTVVVLTKVEDGYKITFKDVESSGNFNQKVFKDLKKALEYAKEIQDANDVEYGLFIESL